MFDNCLFWLPLYVGVLCLVKFCFAVLSVLFSFATISERERERERERELVPQLQLSSCSIVTVTAMYLFLTVPLVSLQCVSVGFLIILTYVLVKTHLFMFYNWFGLLFLHIMSLVTVCRFLLCRMLDSRKQIVQR